MFRKFLCILSFMLAVLTIFSPRTVEASDQPPGGARGAVSLIDGAGRTVAFKKAPQRLVVVGQGPFMPMHLLYMFPVCKDRLVGYEQKYKSIDTFLPVVDAQFPKKTALGTNPGPEQVIALKPDLVIMKSTTSTQLGESLAVLGIPVVYLGMESPEQFLKDASNAGVLLGNRGRAEEIVQFYRSRMDRIDKGIEGVKKGEKPRVLVMEYNERGGKAAVQVPGRSWTQTIQAARAGGAPVWLEAARTSEGWTVINFEQVAAWDPDKIFIIPWYTLDRREVLASFRADPRWRMLRAVKNNEMYLFPSDIFGWDSSEPRWLLGLMWLATKILPGRFGDIDMREEIHRFFSEMYRLDKGVIDEIIMPKVMLEGR
jgi:iron complex transport system substrate-binding protein